MDDNIEYEAKELSWELQLVGLIFVLKDSSRDFAGGRKYSDWLSASICK